METMVSFLTSDISLQILETLPMEEYSNVHLVLKQLFPKMPKVSVLAGRTRHILQNWQKVSKDPVILDIVRGYKIPLQKKPSQIATVHVSKLTREEESLVEEELEALIRKGAIKKVKHQKGDFLRNLFLVPKKGEGTGQ